MKAKKPNKKTILTQINDAKRRIAKERDNLRSLIVELDEIEGDCDETIDALTEAADSLSRYL